MVRSVLTAASILENVLEEPKDPDSETANMEVSTEQNIETDGKLIHFST